MYEYNELVCQVGSEPLGGTDLKSSEPTWRQSLG